MKIPLSWLAEYVDVPAAATPDDVAATLVRVGLEEEDIIGADITGPLVVGKVLTKEPEPQKNGKTINWCSLDVGRGEDDPQWIVCGAHNFEVGDHVVVAMPGSVLPGDFAITPRKTYGHTSNGMICSSPELGLGEDGDGIIVLPEWGFSDTTPGDDALSLLGLVGRDAEGVEINVTPDRGYCFSIRGVAREYAHGLAEPVATVFRDPADVSVPSATSKGFPIAFAEDTAIGEFGIPGCAHFVARKVTGVAADAQTPLWMQRRLSLAGMRPISLVVDITNYVMLALGQPLHAYDVATLDAEHGITVRRAKTGEKLTTLDGSDRELHPEDLLITDGKDGVRPIGIAGVMGGAATEVSASTTDVLIEAAWFDPISIARSARRHKLPSEASKRFERGVDTHLQGAAAQLAVSLLEEHGGGKSDREVTVEGTPRPGVAFDMAWSKPSAVVGVNYTRERVIALLEEVGCTVQDRDSALTVVPPTWRPDLAAACDAAEEVARLDGYEKVPSVVPQARLGGGRNHTQRVRRRVSDALAGEGLHEVLTFPFVSEERLAELAMTEDDIANAVRLTNPMSAEQPLLRPTLLATLVQAARRNMERGAENVALFEIGQVVTGPATTTVPDVPVTGRPTDDQLAQLMNAVPNQPWHAAGVLCGQGDWGGWQSAGRAVDYSDALATVHDLMELFSLSAGVEAAEQAPWHPGRCAQFRLGDDVVGYAGELHPRVAETLRLPAGSAVFELDLDVLTKHAETRPTVAEVSTHGVVKEDIALIVDDTVTVADVEAALREGGGDMLESVRLFDVYRDDKVGTGKKSLAFALRMRATNRTLNADESARIRGAAVGVAAERHNAVLRDA